jgi:hypothetical protein
MSTARSAALVVLALSVASSSCLSSERPNSPAGIGGESGAGDTGGMTGSTGGSPSTGGSKGTGGSTSTGGSPETGGSTSKDAGPSTGGSSGADAGKDMGAAAWPGCLEPVFSGVMPADFCMVYATVCTFTGTSHYTSMADCMAKFHGGSSDGDACKSGHLCRASLMPAAMRTADCASSGTAKCSN